MALITQKEYARRRKITPQYVNKLVSQGKILLKRGLVDPDQADDARTPQRPSAVRPRQKGSNAHGGGRPVRQRSERPEPAGDDFSPAPQSAMASLTRARAVEAGISARLRDLELKEKTKQLLPAVEVRDAMRRQNANVRLRLRGLARPLSPSITDACRSKTDRTAAIAECERLLLEAFDELLHEWETDPLGSVGPAPAAEPAVQTPAGATA